MKIIPERGKFNYASRIAIFFITAALITGMVGCVPTVTLTITGTPGGAVVEPGEGTFTYYAGTEVNLVAEADEGYQFVNWYEGRGHIADLRAAATTIVMNNDYSIHANFAIPTLVWDWYDLNSIENDQGGVYILMNNLNCTTPGYEELAGPTSNGGKGWQPIGSSIETQSEMFHGTFDGQGYNISDLFINRPHEYNVGLFHWVSSWGGIKNLGVVNATVTGYCWVGTLVALSLGTVSNCHSVSSVNGTQYVGGLVGANSGPVSNSYAIGNVTGNEYVGGLLGENGEIVSDCYSTGSVTGNERAGGLVGLNAGNVRNSYATCSVSVTGSFAGGLMGENYECTVSNSYSTGSVTGDAYTGGLIGINGGTVSNSYSIGSVTGEVYVGGLIGLNLNYENIYGIVTNSFWDTETSGQSTSDGGTGKTTAQMKNIATFSGVGWNIIAVIDSGVRNVSYIWNIVDNETYPFLSWQS
jgi:hypothetical protein